MSNSVFRFTGVLLFVVFAVFASTACRSVGKGKGKASKIEIEMIYIAPGTFTMGSQPIAPVIFASSPRGEPGRLYNEARHTVTLTRGFYMGKYAVTQEQYYAVMGVNPSYFNGVSVEGDTYDRGTPPDEVQARRPVEMVNWFEAIVFCNRLSILEGRTPVYSIEGRTDTAAWGKIPDSTTHENFAVWNAVVMNINANGYRLPTEAEWEYACRAGTTTAFNCGTTTPASIDGYVNIVDALGWFAGNSGDKTHQVGLKLPNAFGLYDMHGNVWEWVWDRFGGIIARTDPVGSEAGTLRVSRGGCWFGEAQYLRSAFRGYSFPSFRSYDLGFRAVRNQ